jgi:KDO2-lipid IV(A) lauroyltransferase
VWSFLLFSIPRHDILYGIVKRETRERLYCRLIALVRFCVLRIPRRTSLWIGAAIGRLAFRIAGRERERALVNLQACFPVRSRRELRRIAHRSFRNLGVSIVEIIRFPLLTRDAVNRFVSWEGRERLDAALEEGRGVVLATGHVGNWELFGASLALNGYRLAVVARKLRSRRYNDILCDLRRRVGMRIIFRGESMFRGLRLLRQNGILAILADVDTKAPGVFVEFFGRPAYTPYGPVAVALKSGTPLIPMFIRRLPDDAHRIHVLEPLELTRTGSWESDLLVNTQRFTTVVESFIREHPDQWIWMHERWKTPVIVRQRVTTTAAGTVGGTDTDSSRARVEAEKAGPPPAESDDRRRQASP